MLLSQSSDLGSNEGKPGRRLEGDFMDAIEAHEWKCVDTVNGTTSFSLFLLLLLVVFHILFRGQYYPKNEYMVCYCLSIHDNRDMFNILYQ